MSGLDSEFWECENYPLTYGLNQTNPADYTNFMYGHKTEKHVETVEDEGSGRGDKYLGVIMKNCECADVDHLATRYTDTDYVWPTPNISLDDAGNKPCSGFTSDSSNDYGQCGMLGCFGSDAWPGMNNKAHIWWMRDWSKVLNSLESTAECCVMPTDQTFNCCEGEESNQCYSTGSTCDTNLPRTMQCPPSHYAASPLCIPIMQQYCASSEWGSTSSPTKCDQYMTDFSGAPQSAKQAVLLSGLEWWVENDLQGGQTPPTSDSNLPMVKKMADYCSQWPGLCDIYLQQACQNVTTRDLKKQPELSRLCACFLPDEQYMLPGIIPVECNGMCGINANPEVNGVVKGQMNEATGIREALICNQSTCVIDDVTISMINSTIDGSVDFTQVCGNCPGGSCTCVMNNVTVDTVNAFAEGIDLEQNCKGCSQFIDGTNGQPIGCDGGSSPSPLPPSTSSSQSQNIFTTIEEDIESQWSTNKPFYIAVIVFLILMFVAVITFLVVNSKTS